MRLSRRNPAHPVHVQLLRRNARAAVLLGAAAAHPLAIYQTVVPAGELLPQPRARPGVGRGGLAWPALVREHAGLVSSVPAGQHPSVPDLHLCRAARVAPSPAISLMYDP